MSHQFLYPSILHLPAGYDCTIAVSPQRIAGRLVAGNGSLRYTIRIFFEGEMQKEESSNLIFEQGCLAGPPLAPFTWRDADEAWGGQSGYLEVSLESVDGVPVFRDKTVIDFYSIYSKAGKKSFFSDNAYKYGSPPIINQIALFGQFVDGYPVIHLDRDRDLGYSVVLINPYKKTVNARIVTHDGRNLPGVKVPSQSVRPVRLAALLRSTESSWIGHIQLTANNRLITYVMMHSLREPRLISDHEHLDPFRSDPTHMPAFQYVRQRVGRFFANRGITWRNAP